MADFEAASPCTIADDDVEIEADLTKSFLELEIMVAKRCNEMSGIEFMDIPRLKKYGVLFVKGFVEKSYINSHNAKSIENGLAEGLIEGDMIVRVNMVSGPPYGETGAHQLQVAIISDGDILLVVHRRSDRHEA